MRKFVLLILFISSSFLMSCGQAGKTKAKLNLTLGRVNGVSLATYDGGAMLWGVGPNGSQFGVNLTDLGGDLVLGLDNGTWTFFGVVWKDNNGTPRTDKSLRGETWCVFQTETLSGGEVAVSINFTNSKCNDSKFAPDSIRNQPTGSWWELAELDLASCGDINSIGALTDVCDGNSLAGVGNARSYQVSLDTFAIGIDIPNTGAPLNSGCLIAGTDTTHFESSIATDGMPHIPIGNGSFPIHTTFHSFLSNDCESTVALGSKVSMFPNGLYVANDGDFKGEAKIYYNTSGDKKLRVFFELGDAEACVHSIANIGSEFVMGDGTQDFPFGICTEGQWDLISTDGINHMGDDFVLLSDLDFSNRMRYAPLAVNEPACGSYGNNMIPIGTVCSGNIFSSHNIYNGRFDGREHWLNHPIVFEDNESYMGIFRQLSASSTIKNLKIKKSIIEGDDYVGTLAGKADGGAIKNIIIKDGSVRSRESSNGVGYTGGLIGKVDLVTGGSNLFDQIIIDNMEIESEGEFTGGLIGHLDNQTRTHDIIGSYFSGEIYNHAGDNDAKFAMAGFVGYRKGGGILNISRSSTHGIIEGRNMNSIAGIVGYVSGSSGVVNISDSYSNMLLHSESDSGINASLYTAGIVGQNQGQANSAYNRVYFSGDIVSKCNGSCGTHAVGSFSGLLVAPATENLVIDSSGGSYSGGRDGTASSDLRDSTIHSSFYSAGNGWAATPNDTKAWPRLQYEYDFGLVDCHASLDFDSISTQRTNGRGGSVTNPIKLCHEGQWLAPELNNTNDYYSLGESLNFNLASAVDEDDSILGFAGEIDGNHYALYGLDFLIGIDQSAGIFSTTTSSATIYDLMLFNNRVNTSSNLTIGKGAGLLVGNNAGKLKNIDIKGSHLMADFEGGLIAGINQSTGIISGAYLYNNDALDGRQRMGGAVGLNDGLVEKVSGHIMFTDTTSGGTYTEIGGVVGLNQNGATVSEVNVSVNLNFTGMGNTVNGLGGLIGINSGALINSYSENFPGSRILVGNASGGVGGLVGHNTSGATIEKSYNGIEVLFGYCSVPFGLSLGDGCTTTATASTPSNYGPIVGVNSGSVDSDVFYTNPAYQIMKISDPHVISTGSYDGSNDCSITTSVAHGVTLAANDEVFIGHHNRYFTIPEAASGGGTSYKVDMPVAVYNTSDCDADLASLSQSSFTRVDSSGSNSIGTQISYVELDSIFSFCPSANLTDPEFSCASSEWDIISDEHDSDNDGISDDPEAGFYRLLRLFMAYHNDDPPPVGTPIWSVERDNSNGEKLDGPRLLFDFH
jgi:hypothetical protein